MGDNFDSGGGEQNIAQGNHAIGKQVNNHGPVITTSGDQSPAVNAQTVTITYNSFSPDVLADVRKLAVTDAALASFFKILEEPQVPLGDLDSKLREFACRYQEFKLRLQVPSSDDPEVNRLKKQAEQAFDDGRFSEADTLLNQAKEHDRAAVATLKASLAEQQAALEKRQLSEAESCVEQADLQRLQYRYEKAAQYWQEAAAALPEGYEWERAEYIGAAGYDLYCIAYYAEALSFLEQSLSIYRDIGDLNSEAKLLNNISLIHEAQGEYDSALEFLQQSLSISQGIEDKVGQGTAMNNIATIYHAKGEYVNAFSYLEKSLYLRQEIKDKKGEGNTLISIGRIYDIRGDHSVALSYYEQALVISREIEDKGLESISLDNISNVYLAQEKYDDAIEYTKQSLTINQNINDRRGEGIVLNNLAIIYLSQGDDASALPYCKQSLSRAKEIGAKAEEAGGNWNIGWIYAKKGEVAKAEQYISRAVELMEQLEHPMLDECRQGLEKVRAKLRGK